MPQFICPQCQRAIDMTAMVHALLAPSPSCPHCQATLPEEAREFVDSSDVPQQNNLVDGDAEPRNPFSLQLPDSPETSDEDDFIDLDVVKVDSMDDTREVPLGDIQKSMDSENETTDTSKPIAPPESSAPSGDQTIDLDKSTVDLDLGRAANLDQTTEFDDEPAGVDARPANEGTVDEAPDAQPVESADLNATLDLEQTVAFDDASVTADEETGTVDEAPDAQPVESADLNATLDLEQTVEFDDASVTADEETGTVDEAPDAQPVESADLNATLDLEQTVAFDDESVTADEETGTVDDAPDAQPVESADLNATLDLEQTVAFDDESVTADEETGTVDEAPDAQPVESADLNATLDLEQTVEFDDESVTADEETGTVDDAPDAQPVESADLNATLDLEQTVEFDDESVTADEETGTVDEAPDAQPVESADLNATLDLEQTVEFDDAAVSADEEMGTVDEAPDAPPVESADLNATLDLGQTVEFDDASVAADEGTVDPNATVGLGQTVNAGQTFDLGGSADDDATADENRHRDPNATVDLGKTVNASNGTVDLNDAAGTGDEKRTTPENDKTLIEGASGTQSGTHPGGRTVTDGGSGTFQGDSSRIFVEMPKMWASIDKTMHPGATIRGEDNDDAYRTNLVIQTRELQSQNPQGSFENADYQLLSQLGEGGMGVVFSARQASIDRTVAIKMLKPAGAQDDRQRGKFLSEAVVTGELDHPNIVPIYDLGTNSDGSLFYSMKQVEGTPWDDVITKKPITENLRILMQVADAMAFAHDKGVIHRDLKPENIMLGDYGEVLVMDWGLAAPFQDHEVRSAGGTPAYMSPEMAAGPFTDIGICSDVYLLGAILFEILVGKPPHTGKTVMKCLMSAAKNEIRPHDVRGELMDIAMHAMRSEPNERYPSVKEFQAAIEAYLEHTESIELSSRSAEELQRAESAGDYQGYSRALFGFREAINLWNENPRAKDGLQQATLAYARHAQEKEDYDLAASLLDPQNAEQSELLNKVQSAKRERDARQSRLKTAKRALLGLGLALGGVITGAFFLVNSQRTEALRQKGIAEEQTVIAQNALVSAEESRDDAVAAKTQAEMARAEEQRQREAAVLARTQEASARKAADDAKDVAVQARDQAEREREAAVLAKQQEEIARQQEAYEAYIAKIGLAQAKIQENAFGQARQLLSECPASLRNWEWGRLMYLCTQAQQTLPSDAPLEAIAVFESLENSDRSAKFLATAGRGGKAKVWDLQTGQLAAELDHAGEYVTAIAFSPDGSRIATGSNSPGEMIQVWDWRAGKRLQAWAGHEDAVLSVEFSPSGDSLLTSSYDQTAKIWKQGKLAQTLRGHTWWVWSARFSPNGKQVVTAGHDGIVFVWDAETGEHGEPFREHQGPVYAAAFSPDGQRVASAGSDKTIRLWRPDAVASFDLKAAAQGERTPTPHASLSGHRAAIRDVRFANNNRLISGGHDNAVVLWDVGNEQMLTTLRGHDSWVRSCWLNRDGSQAFSAGFDGLVKKWDVRDYREQQVIRSQTLAGHDDAILGASFSPRGDKVVTASRDRTARQWRLADGAVIHQLAQGHRYLATSGLFLNNGRILATSAVDQTTRLWDVATGSERTRLTDTGRGAVLSVSADEEILLTGGPGGSAKLWQVAQLRNPQPNTVPQPTLIEPGKATVTAAAIASDNGWIALGDSSGRVSFWSPTGKSLGRLDAARGPTRRITKLHCLPNNDLLVASDDNTVTRWDVTRRVELRLFEHPAGVLTLDVDKAGTTLVSCDAKGAVRIWNAGTGALRKTYSDLDLSAAAISDDGAHLLGVNSKNGRLIAWDISAEPDAAERLDLRSYGQVVWAADFVDAPSSASNATPPLMPGVLVIGGDSASVWDLPQQRPRVSFRPNGAVASANYSADGSLIVTASWDNTARIWDAKTGAAVRQLGGTQGHSGYVNAAVFSPDGALVATAADDKTLGVWNVETGMRIATLAAHGGRVMSVRFAANGRALLSVSTDGYALVWNLDGLQMDQHRAFNVNSILAKMRHDRGLRDAAFSRDGRTVVTASDDNLGYVWRLSPENAAGGLWEAKQLVTLSGHTASIASVDLSTDGSRVITGSADFSAKLWDAKTGKEILTLSGHPREVTTVSFSPNGQQILSGSQDGTAIVWPTVDWTDQGVFHSSVVIRH